MLLNKHRMAVADHSYKMWSISTFSLEALTGGDFYDVAFCKINLNRICFNECMERHDKRVLNKGFFLNLEIKPLIQLMFHFLGGGLTQGWMLGAFL